MHVLGPMQEKELDHSFETNFSARHKLGFDILVKMNDKIVNS